ncbi:hypothetical protein B0H15DRAFT_949826 [Mycena belliarum]|uniref:Ribonuclease H1 N-terminal domain-containing protein n=1 Tax=Mycena belliarum TaxID=1033014 RepID=A0AAD6XQT9_9AGAR|nr:hypothetical protein B0H15DRAFT_949826 [Mycena belliae]
MTALESSTEHDDAELLEMLAQLNVGERAPNRHTSVTPPAPRTPSPPPYTPPRAGQTFPTAVYRFTSPTRSGYTTNWSRAANAPQGVAAASVSTIQQARSKKPTYRKKAYAVFWGKRCGIFHTWNQTAPLVLGVPNAIYRGYASILDAEAAFAYASARGWTRSSDTDSLVAIPSLPQPHLSSVDNNPLNGTEACDDRWYVVYIGITPGVYRSHLECQLNTLGLSGVAHEAITGEAAARSKYDAAVASGEIRALPPRYNVISAATLA